MSGQPPPSQQQSNRGGWNRGGPPSPIYYRPPSPWAPSPPPIISGPRRTSLTSPGPGGHHQQMMGSPNSPIVNSIPPRPQPMSPLPSSGVAGNLRGTRGPIISQPRPRWPDNQSQNQQYYPPPPSSLSSNYHDQRGGRVSQSPHHFMVCPSPPTIGGVNGPRPYQQPPQPPPHIHSYSPGPGPRSSFQLSPTPSPVVFQTPHEFVYNNANNNNVNVNITNNNNAPYEQPSKLQYEYVGVPLEPPQPKSYIIYDDEDDQGPTTAEIIANQSQDYIDEKLAEYQMTILALQGKFV